MKRFYKVSLAIYLLFLLWLVLFKCSSDPLGVIASYQSKSLNIVPFAGYSLATVHEMIDNFVVFIPFGLLLGVVFKHAVLWQKLASIAAFSVAAVQASR